MGSPQKQPWLHDHTFDGGNAAGERGTRLVVVITALMMVVEIFAGWWFNSMALLADGWHMSSHALAIGLSAFAYAMARRHAGDPRFAFGTWKIEILGGFTSALFLLGIAAWMVFASVERILAPRPIHYVEAIVVALVGLGVNVLCAFILGHAHYDHPHGHEHHQHGHHDLNLRSAYLHVIADAATSVLAIVALGGGLIFGWSWLDPVMGIVGAILVAIWAWGLIRDTTRILLDREMDHPVVAEVRQAIEEHPEWGASARVVDLHVWRVGKQQFACIVAVVSENRAITTETVRACLAQHEELAHITIEIHHRPLPSPNRG